MRFLPDSLQSWETSGTFFEKYLRGEINLMEYATQSGIAYETAKQKTYNIRNRIRTQVVGFMDKKMGGIG